VKRPTTGRRHPRSGSIPVTELIRKRPAKLDVPQEHRALANALVLASAEEPEDKPVSHRRPQQRRAQLVKVAGLGVAACLLAGSITLASVITHNREQDAAPSGQSFEITGEQALLPNAYVNAAQQQAGATKPAIPSQVRNTESGSFPYTPDAPTSSSTSSTQAPQRPKASTASQLVREFYQLIASDPAQAFSLLSPEVLNADLGRFVQAWSVVSEVKVIDVQDQKDGTVITVVSMKLPDGSSVRLKQLLQTAGGSQLRIVGAQLLSAQHS
jgi:hypothetical protein